MLQYDLHLEIYYIIDPIYCVADSLNNLIDADNIIIAFHWLSYYCGFTLQWSLLVSVSRIFFLVGGEGHGLIEII